MSKYVSRPNNLEAFWMPFTANRQFKQTPRMFVAAKDMHYTTDDGRQVLDGTAGLWCCNAGHARPKIVEAVQQQVGELDYAPAFQLGHPKVFELASALVELTPPGMNHAFFTNSGSESVETALKMAIAYHRVKGEGSRTRLIGRERGYHGVNFGGISVGGIVSNRKMFGTPMAGSTGVLMPPVGYLKRLREICDKHGILLIFDEVITGFGRLGGAFSADAFGVVPDIMTTAKGLTSGVIPMGAVFVRDDIHDAFMTGPEHLIEFFHGYTYSGNPVACAAALGALETYREEELLTRATELAPYWEDALHSLRDLPHVIDIRNYGLIGAIELEPIAGEVKSKSISCLMC